MRLALYLPLTTKHYLNSRALMHQMCLLDLVMRARIQTVETLWV